MFGNAMPKFPRCGSCKQEILLAPAHYESGVWTHTFCNEKAKIDLQRANEVAARYGLPPQETFKKRYNPNRTMQDNPQFFNRPYQI